MSQRGDCEDKVIKDALKKEFYRRNRIVWKSLLSASNKVKAFNSICIGVLSYSFGVINWTKVELEEMDIRVRKERTMNKAFNKHSDTNRLYLKSVQSALSDLKHPLLNIHSLSAIIGFSLLNSILLARFPKQSFAQTCLKETDNGKLQEFNYSTSMITNRGTVERRTGRIAKNYYAPLGKET